MQNKLTRREKDVFNLLLDGAKPKEIAYILKISYDTVTSHQLKIYRKLDVHSIDELLGKYKKEKYFHTPDMANPRVIFLEDGTYFTVRTYGEAPLIAWRYANKERNKYSEACTSDKLIKLSDIYSGTIDNLIPNPTINNSYRVRISGTIDKKCKNMRIYIFYVNDKTDWVPLCMTSDDKLVSIGPGRFSKTISFRHEGIDLADLPEGGVFIFSLQNQLLDVWNNYVVDSGERIPDDMPDGTIWATIKNLKIEPLDMLAQRCPKPLKLPGNLPAFLSATEMPHLEMLPKVT